MHLIRILSSLIFVFRFGYGFGVTPQINSQTLLKRLESARGNRQAIGVLKLLVKLGDPGFEELKDEPIPVVVETIEEIIVISAPRNHSSKFLNQIRLKSQEVAQLSNDLECRLNGLGWDSRLLFGSSLSKIVTNYLNHELHSMLLMKERIVYIDQESLKREIRLCLFRCRSALTAALSTISLMQAKDLPLLRATVQNTFSKVTEHETQEFGTNLQVSITMQRNATVIEDQIKYLRENLAVILKSGIFMVFCFTFKIYICSFIFGVLLTLSTVIWIAIFLQLVDV